MKINLFQSSFLLICLIGLLSCTKSLFPLCPRLSDTKPSNQNGISKTLFDICKERKIKITILSTNIAEFSGPYKQMKWLQDNYHILICDFDQDTSILGRTEYTNCLSKSQDWIKIIQSTNPGNLMLDGSLYCPTCVPNQFCH
jgi:hypothetical protein